MQLKVNCYEYVLILMLENIEEDVLVAIQANTTKGSITG